MSVSVKMSHLPLILASLIMMPGVLSNRSGIYETTFSEFAWFSSDLRNPCNRINDKNGTFSSNTYRPNKSKLRFTAGNIERRMRSIQVFECSDYSMQLTSLPKFSFEKGTIEHESLYKQIMLYSVHFRVMAHDWKHGQTCHTTPNLRRLQK